MTLQDSDGSSRLRFPPSFIWGAATSAYQIEGAASLDGRGPSVWDDFCRRKHAVRNGDTGEVACDHYHRFEDDVTLMADLGLDAYRLSISWPRVLPEGTGAVNEPGLAFYDRLVDALLARGVQPWVTLFHWDYPSALTGGWLERSSADAFVEYTRVIVNRLSDRVTNWITLNEPQCYVGLGLVTGIHAPGLKLSRADALLASHNTLLAHGRATQVIRNEAKSPPVIGFAPVGRTIFPASSDPADVEAARSATMSTEDDSMFSNTWFLDPIRFGRYPEDGLARFGSDVPDFPESDLEVISTPIDFIGLNIYQGGPARATEDGYEMVPLDPDHPVTDFDWPITPEALEWGPRFHHDRYGLPIVITENGMANADAPGTDDRVRDDERVDYLVGHLRALERASRAGADIRGYFVWSMLDNFEWAEGYTKRFGIIHVDFETQRRTPKDSYYWYREAIAENGVNLTAEIVTRKPGSRVGEQ